MPMKNNSALPEIIVFHKPASVIVTKSDERGRKTVYDILPDWVREQGYIPAGRLDRDTRGLLFFLKDGRLMDRLTRPGAVIKGYTAHVRGRISEKQLAEVVSGVEAGKDILKAISAEVRGYAGPAVKLFIRLDEGKNRHIRRMFGALCDERTGKPLKVTDLKRTVFGPLVLDIPSGSYRFLRREEISALLKSVKEK